MFKNILLLLREKVRNRSYIMTLHAEEEMAEHGLECTDVENAILN